MGLISIILWLIIVTLLLYKGYKWSIYRPHGFPPGPPRLPFFGSYLLFLLLDWKNLHKGASILSKFYKTKLLGFWHGPVLMIYATDIKIIREILYRTEFDGKPDVYIARVRHPQDELKGVFFLDGPVWKEQRWFMLRYMRDFGFGRRHDGLESQIREEIMSFITMVRDGPKHDHEKVVFRSGNTEIKLPMILSATMINCFFEVIMSERVPRSEQGNVYELVKSLNLFAKENDTLGRMISLRPWLKHYFPEWTGYKNLRNTSQGFQNFIQSLVDKQMATYEPGHIRHFLDMYIAKMKEAEEIGDNSKGFDYDQFIFAVMDFFIPVAITVPCHVGLLIQATLRQKRIADRIRNEIETVVGDGRLPSLDDRINMPFTEACIRESMRIDTLLPSGVPHRLLKDTQLAGYSLPADTIVVTGLHAMHMDKELWGDPEIFRPERFLTADGKLDLKADISLPFAAGKRLCAGETFSRNLIFLYITAIFQNFKLSIPETDTIEKIQKRNRLGLVMMPDYWIKCEKY